MTTALAIIPPEASAVISRMKETAEATAAVVEVLPLTDREDEVKAGQLLRALATLRKEGEDVRKATKAPHKERCDEIDRAFRGPRREIERVEDMLRRRISEAMELREAARQKALAEAAEAAKARDHAAANTAMMKVEEVDVAGLDGISERWTWEVASVDLSKVPREYLTIQLDLQKVRAEISAANREGRPPQVEGVTFRQKAGIAVRRMT